MAPCPGLLLNTFLVIPLPFSFPDGCPGQEHGDPEPLPGRAGGDAGEDGLHGEPAHELHCQAEAAECLHWGYHPREHRHTRHCAGICRQDTHFRGERVSSPSPSS